MRSHLGEKPWLVLALALVFLALLIAFTALGLSSRSDSRRQSEQRFAGEAALSARLTSALLSSSVGGSEAAAAKALGAPSLSPSTLDALVTQSHLAYLLVLDQSGKVIASSSGAAAAARAKTIGSQTQIRHALAGQPWLSDILPPPPGLHQDVLEWALPFTTSSGRRVEVEALDPNLLSGFFGTYLRQLQQTSGGAAFILDSRDHVLGSGSGTIKIGERPSSTGLLAALAKRPSGFYDFSGSQRYFSSSAVAGTTWRVVMGIRTSALFPALAGSESWFLYAVLAAFALAGGVSVLLFHRSLEAGAALRQSNSNLVALNSTLEQRVAERTAAAEARATELGRSNAELEQFSSIASHDLQEPLRKIRMFGDRLRERLGADLPAEPAADLDRIESAAGRMQHLINDLLDFSRVNHRGNAFEAVDLGELTGEVAADLEARIVELDGRVEVGELPVIEADRTQMRQLMQNLVGNALKFHRDGVPPVVRISGEIVSGSAPRFQGEAAAGDRCVITVSDNGIGFDEKHSERVFAAFERLHGRSAYEGTGIGLSIVRKIVWRHGGHIVATGTPDQGATFTVTLPLVQPNRANGHNAGDER